MSDFYSEASEHNIAIKLNEALSCHTSFKIGGEVSFFAEPRNAEEISELLHLAKKHSVRTFTIGNGSNMLVPDEGMDGLFIHIGEKMSKIELVSPDVIRCEAGALLVRVCNFALENGLSGMETVYGIPGSVGGGLYMNAGAYGGEMKDFTVRAEYVDRNGEKREIDVSDMDLSYRHSIFSSNLGIITAVYIKLVPGDKDKIRAKMNELMQRRKDKQPLEYPSAGSVFKRPEGYFAGALIEECGLKGKTVGGAQVSEKHAGFIINKGSATAKDVLELISLCQNIVLEKKGVKLESEIRLLK